MERKKNMVATLMRYGMGGAWDGASSATRWGSYRKQLEPAPPSVPYFHTPVFCAHPFSPGAGGKGFVTVCNWRFEELARTLAGCNLFTQVRQSQITVYPAVMHQSSLCSGLTTEQQQG